MPTYDFTLTRNELITGALRILGVISQGQTPDSTQITDGAQALNILCKSWEAEGMPVWAMKTQVITPVASTTTTSIGASKTVNIAKPERIHQAFYTNNTSNISVPMIGLTRQQYYSLSNREQTGFVTQYFWDDLNTYGDMYWYLTPSTEFVTDYTITIVYQAPFADFDTSTDVPDFPQYWLRALKYGLADEMAMEYGYPGKDRQELMLRAQNYKQEALAFTQEEGSLFFGIDYTRGR